MPRHSPCALYNLIVIFILLKKYPSEYLSEVLYHNLHAFEDCNISFVTKNSISYLCAIFKELYLKDQSLSKLNREDSAFLEFKLLV